MKTCCGTPFDLRGMADHLATAHGFKPCCGRAWDPLDYAYHREIEHGDVEPLRAYQCKLDDRCTRQDGHEYECEIPCPNPSRDLLNGHEAPCPYKCGQDDVANEASVAELAQQLFNAYNNRGPNPWKTWDGKPVPLWDALSDQVRMKWTAVARESLFRVGLLHTTDRG